MALYLTNSSVMITVVPWIVVIIITLPTVVNSAKGHILNVDLSTLHEISYNGYIDLNAHKDNYCSTANNVSVKISTPHKLKLKATLPGGPLDENKSFIWSFESDMTIQSEVNGTIHMSLQQPIREDIKEVVKEIMRPIDDLMFTDMILSITPLDDCKKHLLSITFKLSNTEPFICIFEGISDTTT